MQFRVAPNPVSDPSSLPKQLRSVQRIPESAAVRTRELTVTELDNVLAEPMTHLLDDAALPCTSRVGPARAGSRNHRARLKLSVEGGAQALLDCKLIGGCIHARE